jgi:hypothetical protein
VHHLFLHVAKMTSTLSWPKRRCECSSSIQLFCSGKGEEFEPHHQGKAQVEGYRLCRTSAKRDSTLSNRTAGTLSSAPPGFHPGGGWNPGGAEDKVPAVRTPFINLKHQADVNLMVLMLAERSETVKNFICGPGKEVNMLWIQISHFVKIWNLPNILWSDLLYCFTKKQKKRQRIKKNLQELKELLLKASISEG